MKKFIVYAFEPFGKHNTNISEEVLKSLPKLANFRKHLLKVNFRYSDIFTEEFRKDIEEFAPDVIIELGQYPKGEKIRIETIAQNKMKSKSIQERKIDPGGPDILKASYSISPDEHSMLSENAGKYVCNYSMYKILQYLEGKDIMFAFLHIPKSFDVQVASDFVRELVSGN